MKFTKDQISNITIRHIESGTINIGGELVCNNIALMTNGIIRNWQACVIEELTEQDLGPLFVSEPELVLLGTGPQLIFPPRELFFALARRGIGLEAMDTAAACRTFNILASEGRRVAAVLIVKN
ncbi:MTH938/NDUFAF3 family protein [Woeseiaceae bacterium]|nr:MTH938/NDUFAF3 family protein [Woeseiaceae bacterium]